MQLKEAQLTLSWRRLGWRGGNLPCTATSRTQDAKVKEKHRPPHPAHQSAPSPSGVGVGWRAARTLRPRALSAGHCMALSLLPLCVRTQNRPCSLHSMPVRFYTKAGRDQILIVINMRGLLALTGAYGGREGLRGTAAALRLGRRAAISCAWRRRRRSCCCCSWSAPS